MSLKTQDTIVLTEKDLPKQLVGKLKKYNIIHVVRFLDLALNERAVLLKILDISSSQLTSIVESLSEKYSEIIDFEELINLDSQPWETVSGFGAHIENPHEYEKRVKKNLRTFFSR